MLVMQNAGGVLKVVVAILGLLFGCSSARMAAAGARVDAGLQLLYDFSAMSASTAPDLSLAGEAINLKIGDTNLARKIEGGLEVIGKTLVRSEKPAARLSKAVQLSGEITIEAWIKPAALDQTGPARIVTLSKDTSERNFTLGQDGNRYDVRLRTSQTSVSGTPSLAAKPGSVSTNRTHVVYTRDRAGRARIYVDGKLNIAQRVSMFIPGPIKTHAVEALQAEGERLEFRVATATGDVRDARF